VTRLDDDQIEFGLRDFRVRAGGLVVFGALLVVVFFALVSLPEGPPGEFANLVAAFALVGGPVCVGGGVWLLARSRTLRRIVTLEEFNRRLVDRPRGAGFMRIHADAHGPESLGGVSDNPLRLRKLPRGTRVEMMVAGGRDRWAVVSPPGKAHLFLFQRTPRWLHWRTRNLGGFQRDEGT
jgi:hypothetical protein